MKSSTPFSKSAILPLTCTRTGTCCHGKLVRLNPWELAVFAQALGLSASQFRDKYCWHGGVQIRFDGTPGWKGLPACSLYDSSKGCIAHEGRPLACRLFPLGREKKGQESHYMHLGKGFPCLDGCSEVKKLPQITVSEYLAGQGVREFETAQDAYLEVMQDLAEWAFALLLETGVTRTAIQKTSSRWESLGITEIAAIANSIPQHWRDLLTIPDIPVSKSDCLTFIQIHTQQIQAQAQKEFGTLQEKNALCDASLLVLSLSVLLAFSVGANPKSLVERWVCTLRSSH